MVAKKDVRKKSSSFLSLPILLSGVQKQPFYFSEWLPGG